MKVVNLKTTASLDRVVRVDRGSTLGNPFILQNERHRSAVIQGYREYLWAIVGPKALEPRLASVLVAKKRQLMLATTFRPTTRSQFLTDLNRVKNASQLGCWCAPKPCHADVLVNYFEYLKAGR